VSRHASNADRAPLQRRILALWCPFLATDRLHTMRRISRSGEQADRPLVVVEKIHGALRLTAVDVAATRFGLTSGLTLADARARFPDLSVADANAKADAALIDRAALLCDRYTPLVALDPPDGLQLDITGCAHLFGGESALRTEIVTRIENMGLHVCATIAGTPDAARALARFGRTGVAPPGKDEALVRQLPVAALTGSAIDPLPAETVTALRRAGLKTIGALADRPPQVLAARFGQAFVSRLQRTLGREFVGITPLRPAPDIVTDRHFAEPLMHAEAIEGVLAMLAEDTASTMGERDQGGRVFSLSLFRNDGAVRRLTVETGRPSRDTKTIVKLFHERLASLADPIDPGFGFDTIRLAVPVTEPLGALQPRFDADAKGEETVGDLVDRLIVRFGADRVLRFEPCDTHDPDHAARLVTAARAHRPRRVKPSAIAWPAPEAGEPPTRPLQLFDPPHPIDALAEVPDGPPLRFRWRRVLHEVARAEGPERIAPEWWHAPTKAATRDYYRVEDTEGHRFWIFRHGHYAQDSIASRWFLHGLFA
jgi:protein ImuB